jgi:hypothetical protein
MEPLTAEDFVIYKENGNVMSGGYSVNSIILNNNGSAIHNSNNQVGGETVSSSLFSDYAIPGGLLFSTQTPKPNKYETYNNNIADNSLFDNLLKLIEPNNKKYNIKTKKNKAKNKITRKVK